MSGEDPAATSAQTLSGAHTPRPGAGDPAPTEPPRAVPDLFGGESAATPQRTEVAPRAGPGRPAGAVNRVKSKVREYALALGFRDPLLTLAAIQSPTRADMSLGEQVAELAAAMGIKRVEAAELIRKAATDLMPYFHGKKPVAIELPAGTRPIFMIDASDDDLAAIIDGEAVSLDDDGEEYQGVSDAASDGSDGEGSDDAG